MAVLETVTSSATSSSSTLSFSCTIGSNSDRVLIVGVAANMSDATARIVSGITYNSVALTNITTIGITGGDNTRVEIWKLVAPDIGTNDVVITMDGPTSQIFGIAYPIYDADQTTVNRSPQSNTDGTTPTTSSSLVCDSDVDDIVIDVIGWRYTGQGTVTEGGGQTIQGSSESVRFAGSSEVGANPTVTMSWSWATPGWTPSTHAAVSIISVSGGGGPTENFPRITDIISLTKKKFFALRKRKKFWVQEFNNPTIGVLQGTRSQPFTPNIEPRPNIKKRRARLVDPVINSTLTLLPGSNPNPFDTQDPGILTKVRKARLSEEPGVPQFYILSDPPPPFSLVQFFKARRRYRLQDELINGTILLPAVENPPITVKDFVIPKRHRRVKFDLLNNRPISEPSITGLARPEDYFPKFNRETKAKAKIKEEELRNFTIGPLSDGSDEEDYLRRYLNDRII